MKVLTLRLYHILKTQAFSLHELIKDIEWDLFGENKMLNITKKWFISPIKVDKYEVET